VLVIQILITGIVIGAIYAITGAGLVVIYRATGVINFAHGSIAAVGLFCAYGGLQLGWPYPLAAAVTIAASALLAAGLGLFAGSALFQRRPVLDLIVLTISVTLILQGLEGLIVGQNVKAFPAVANSNLGHIGSVTITAANVTVVAVCLAVFLALYVFFERTRTGAAMRALNENAEATRQLGVPVTSLRTLAWTIAGALAGIAGLFVAPIYSLQPSSMDVLVVYGFAVVVAGGFESVIGALICGVLVGILQNAVSVFTSSKLVLISVALFMLVVLTIRPAGLLGRRPVVRV
jgi:branched-chain amino acid transport system permease protein